MLWVESYGNPIIDSTGEIVKITGVAYDITERKTSEELIKRMAYHDQLTGLPNRYLLNDYLQKYLSLCKRHNNSLAVMFLDLDDFKMVNDHHGHDTGDALLKEVAIRLENSIREGDVAARLGGDEFIILLKDADESQAAEVAERLITTFNKPFHIKKYVFSISTSIGISMYPHDAQEGELLIQMADAAMYCAKRQGKNKHRFLCTNSVQVLRRYSLRGIPSLLQLLSTKQLQHRLSLTAWRHDEGLTLLCKCHRIK